MNPTLLKSLAALVPASMLMAGSLALVLKGRPLYALLQLLGAVFLTVVVFTHVCKAVGLFPEMQWGLEHSAGHYFDFCSVVLGFTLFPLGYLLQAFRTTEG